MTYTTHPEHLEYMHKTAFDVSPGLSRDSATPLTFYATELHQRIPSSRSLWRLYRRVRDLPGRWGRLARAKEACQVRPQRPASATRLSRRRSHVFAVGKVDEFSQTVIIGELETLHSLIGSIAQAGAYVNLQDVSLLVCDS